MWGYRGKDLIASTRIIQHLLEDPLWIIKANKFHPLGSICNISQLEKMRNLRLDIWIEGLGVISKVGDALIPEEFLDKKNRFGSVADATLNNGFRGALEELKKRDFYLTQEIGTQYMKRFTDPATDILNPIEDLKMTQYNVSVRSNGINRPFKTRRGVMGFASSAI